MDNKKMTLNYYNAPYGQIFWDQDSNIVKVLHENDANYRSEYFNPMFEHFGIEVIRHTKLPNFLTQYDLFKFGIDE